MQYNCTLARIGVELPLWFLVERKRSVVTDGIMSWIPAPTERMDVRVNGWKVDIKLKDAVQMHNGKNWRAIAALVPGRAEIQCHNRWRNVLDPSTWTDRANARTGKWAEDEDSELREAVQTHGGKNWVEIVALVPGRTKKQCLNRWHNSLVCTVRKKEHGSLNMAPDNADADPIKGTRLRANWTSEEDATLKDAITNTCKKQWSNEYKIDWAAVAALVSNRTKRQCSNRWHNVLDPSIDRNEITVSEQMA
jgi:hypothetical protein